MQEIAHTELYTLSVDTTKNRIYCIVAGNDPLENSSFIRDWERAKCLVSPGFTVLTDVSRIRDITKDWVATSVKLQKRLIEAGLAGTAELLSERVAECLHIDHINRISRGCCYTKEEIFTNRRIAEAWLDRISRKMTCLSQTSTK